MLSVTKLSMCFYALLAASAAGYTNSPLFQRSGYVTSVPKSGQRVSKYASSNTSLNMMESVNAILPSAIFLGGMVASIAMDSAAGESDASMPWVTNPWVPPALKDSLTSKTEETKEDAPAAETTAVASTTTDENASTKADEPKSSGNIILKTLRLVWRIFQKIIAPWRKWELIA